MDISSPGPQLQEVMNELQNLYPLNEEKTNLNTPNVIQSNPYPKFEEENNRYTLNEVQSKHSQKNNKKFKCTKIEITDLSNKNPIITISSPEKINGGIFSKPYTIYTIKTYPLNFEVKRRYSHFEWLHSVLSNIFKGSVIPIFPKKIILIASDENEFNKIKNFSSKIQPSEHLTDVKSIDGMLNLDITKEKEIYFVNIKDNSERNESLLKNLSMTYKMLIQEMEKYYENKYVKDSYHFMGNIMQIWSETDEKEIKILKESVEQSQSNFYNEEKKEGLYNSEDSAQWEIEANDKINLIDLNKNKQLSFKKMLPKETQYALNMSMKYWYYLNQIIKEYERIGYLNGKNYRAVLAKNFMNHKNIIEDLNENLKG